MTFTPTLLFRPIPSTDGQASRHTGALPYPSVFIYLQDNILYLGLAPETYQFCVYAYINLFGAPLPLSRKETSLIHFSRSKCKFVSYLQTKCWSEFVWHLHLSMTTIVALILAHILSRKDNWGLFSFSLAAWNNLFGQSITLVSKMPAKHYQRQAKMPSTQTKTLASSQLWSSDIHLNSN